MSTSCILPPLTFKPLTRPKPPIYEPNLSPLSNPNRLPLSRTTLVRCSTHEREERQWLREEQRWLREERRWLREESRWHLERETLIRTISALNHRIEELERKKGADESNSVTWQIGSGGVPLVLEAASGEREKVVREREKVVVEEEREKVVVEEEREKVVVEEEVKRKRTLRSGSEGDDVRELQEALQKLGFYCGEEDVEFSSYSSGTERAVKTWQASLGVSEDGIMTIELQERLYTESPVDYSSVVLEEDPKGTTFPKEGVNGAAVASVTEISEIWKKGVENKSNTENDVSQQRVFLLGENRWEEPSRLVGRNKANGGAKSKGSTTTCLSCRGVGRVLCAECDGSGEPNIEPQFLEWVDEGMKCPYCEGRGFSTCDVCNGKGEAIV